jgi:hypothetical protein
MAKILAFQKRESNHEQDSYHERLMRAIKERDSFLEKHPNLMGFQKEIDRRMRGTGSSQNRMAILAMMMDEKLAELRHNLISLASHLHEVQDIMENKPQRKLTLVKK